MLGKMIFFFTVISDELASDIVVAVKGVLPLHLKKAPWLISVFYSSALAVVEMLLPGLGSFLIFQGLFLFFVIAFWLVAMLNACKVNSNDRNVL